MIGNWEATTSGHSLWSLSRSMILAEVYKVGDEWVGHAITNQGNGSRIPVRQKLLCDAKAEAVRLVESAS